MNNQQFLNLLALSKNELLVFNSLSEGAIQSVATIVLKTKLPRMTVYGILASLKKRGLLSTHKVGKRVHWEKRPDEKIIEQIFETKNFLTQSKELRITIGETGFAILYGVDALYTSWQSLMDLPPNTRVYAIQPTASIKYSLEKLTRERIDPLQENIRNKPIIVDGIVPDDYYSFMKDFYGPNKENQQSVLESFLGRATAMTFVAKEYFQNSATELIILPQKAYLTDWKNEVSIEIKNPIMHSFLKELYDLAKGYGKKVDQNAYIKELLTQI